MRFRLDSLALSLSLARGGDRGESISRGFCIIFAPLRLDALCWRTEKLSFFFFFNFLAHVISIAVLRLLPRGDSNFPVSVVMPSGYGEMSFLEQLLFVIRGGLINLRSQFIL